MPWPTEAFVRDEKRVEFMTDVDTRVYELRRKKRAAYNSRVLSVYFKSARDLRLARKAAKKACMPLATFIRDAALKLAEKVLAA
jgi:hypothetical protein